MTNIDTIREAQDKIELALAEVARICHGGKWKMCIPANPKTDSDIIISVALVEARSALSTIEADANPNADVKILVDRLNEIIWHDAEFDEDLNEAFLQVGIDKPRAAALITAHGDAIRRKCATKLIFDIDNSIISSKDADFAKAFNAGLNDARKTIKAAILGTEPAREESK